MRQIIENLNVKAMWVTLGGLWISRIILHNAAQATAQIDSIPNWISPILTSIANLTGALLVLAILGLIGLYLKQGLTWLTKSDSAQSEKQAGETDQAQALTKDLTQTVISLERYGQRSESLLIEAERQTLALVELVKGLTRKSSEMGQIAASFEYALDALATDDPKQIALAAGRVKDEHIRHLMLLPYDQGDSAYWQHIITLVAVQLGNAQRWQAEYSQLSVGLMGEVSIIKTKLVAVAAQIEAAQVARPLLQAKVNLDSVGQYLRLSTNETARPERTLNLQNIYTLSK